MNQVRPTENWRPQSCSEVLHSSRNKINKTPAMKHSIFGYWDPYLAPYKNVYLKKKTVEQMHKMFQNEKKNRTYLCHINSSWPLFITMPFKYTAENTYRQTGTWAITVTEPHACWSSIKQISLPTKTAQDKPWTINIVNHIRNPSIFKIKIVLYDELRKL